MKNYYLVILWFFVSIAHSAKGGHAAGGYIHYQNIKNNLYGVELQLYRDCRGISVSSSITVGVDFLSSSGGLIGTIYMPVKRVSIIDNSFRCSSFKMPCSTPNATSIGDGIEKQFFYGELDLDSAPYKTYFKTSGFCEVRFFWSDFSRSNYITTLSGSGWSVYFSSSLKFCNSSGTKVISGNSNPQPIFDKPDEYCCNVKQNLIFAGVDTVDFDSVIYRLVPAKDGSYSTSLTYASPFSYNFPLTPFCPSGPSVTCTPKPTASSPQGFYFDSFNGVATFIPTKCSEVAVIAVDFREYRKVNGSVVLVGRSTMDRVFYTNDLCPKNYVPSLNAGSGGEWVVGINYSQKMSSKDDTGSLTKTVDTTTIKILNLPIGSSLVRNSPFKVYDTSLFSWKPNKSWAGKRYKMYVAAFDNKCDIPAYSVKVLDFRFRLPLSTYRISTYLDKNNDCKRDTGESYVGNARLVLEGKSAKDIMYFRSVDSTSIKIQTNYGSRKLYFIPNEMYYANCKDTFMLNVFNHDSIISLDIPVRRRTFITGRLFNDHDTDCAKTIVEDRAIGGVAVCANNNYCAWTNDDGTFTLYLDTGTYNLSLPAYLPCDSCNTSKKMLGVKVLKDSFVNLGDLAVYNDTVDLNVVMYSEPFINGGTSKVTMRVRNDGSMNLKKHTGSSLPKFYLSYQKKLAFVSCAGCIVDTAKGLLSWKTSFLDNGESNLFFATFSVPTAKNKVGDNIFIGSYLENVFTDMNNSNNAAGLRMPVLASTPVNDKSAELVDTLACSDRITYRIDFRNKGMDTVRDVLIVDSMDKKLDVPTLVPLYSGAPVSITSKNKRVTFYIQDQNLTDSVTNYTSSSGAIIYSVHPVKGLDTVMSFSNKASLFLDGFAKGTTSIPVNKTVVYERVLGLDKKTYCGESNIVLSYQNNYITQISKLKAELSDTSGSFKFPTILKIFYANPYPFPSNITMTLPMDLKSSKKYRLRLSPVYPDSSLFVTVSAQFEIVEPAGSFKFNKNDYCDKDSIFIILAKAKSYNVYYNNTLILNKVGSGKFFLSKSNLTKNDVKVVMTDSINCPKTRIVTLISDSTPIITAKVSPGIICKDSFTKLTLTGPYKYNLIWKGNYIYDTIPAGIYNVPGDTKIDSLKIIAISSSGCVNSSKIASSIYEQANFWSVKIADTMVCRNAATKVNLGGMSKYNVQLDTHFVYLKVPTGSYSLFIPKSNLKIWVTGYSSRNCPYVKVVNAPRISNPNEFSFEIADDTICKYQSTFLKLHDRNVFDVYINKGLAFASHDSSPILLTGDTMRKPIMIIAYTPFGCKDTQYGFTPALEVLSPMTVMFSDSLYCQGDSAVLELGAGKTYNVYKNNILTLSNVKGGFYNLYTDSLRKKYRIIGESVRGCLDTGYLNGPVWEQFSPRLDGTKPNPFCDGDSVELELSKSPFADMYDRKDRLFKMQENEKYKVAVPSDSGVSLYAIFKSSRNCIYYSNTLYYKSNDLPPMPSISLQGDSIVSSSKHNNLWYKYGSPPQPLLDTSNSLRPAASGIYLTKVTNSSGCSRFSDTLHFIKRSLTINGFNDDESKVRLFPIPTVNSLTIISNIGILKCDILTIEGQYVPFRLTYNSDKELVVNCTGIPPGFYLIKIRLKNGESLTGKVILDSQ